MNDTPATAPAEVVSDADPVAKPWYLSKTVLSLVAGLLMSLVPKIAKLCGFDIGITQDQANEFALFAVPQAVALYGRLTATHVITGTAASAKALNLSAATPPPAS